MNLVETKLNPNELGDEAFKDLDFKMRSFWLVSSLCPCFNAATQGLHHSKSLNCYLSLASSSINLLTASAALTLAYFLKVLLIGPLAIRNLMGQLSKQDLLYHCHKQCSKTQKTHPSTRPSIRTWTWNTPRWRKLLNNSDKMSTTSTRSSALTQPSILSSTRLARSSGYLLIQVMHFGRHTWSDTYYILSSNWVKHL